MHTHGTCVHANARVMPVRIHVRLCVPVTLNGGIVNVEYEISRSWFYRSTWSTSSHHRSRRNAARESRWIECRAMYKGGRPITYVRILFKSCKSEFNYLPLFNSLTLCIEVFGSRRGWMGNIWKNLKKKCRVAINRLSRSHMHLKYAFAYNWTELCTQCENVSKKIWFVWILY